MSYNDGSVHDNFYDNSENWEEISKDFSEGNLILQKALILMWSNGIKTIGCCNGHPDENKSPYIGIEVSNDNLWFIITIINSILKNKVEGVGISFLTPYNQIRHKNYNMVINMSEQNKDLVFEILIKSIKKIKNIFNRNEIVQIANKLNEYIFVYNEKIKEHGSDVLSVRHFKYDIDLDNFDMFLSFTKPGEIILPNDYLHHLNDYLDDAHIFGRIPFGMYKCDIESLKQLMIAIFSKHMSSDKFNRPKR